MNAAGATPARRSLARHLHGCGLELGPGHEPFPVPAAVDVRYLDRWAPDDNRALFPELGDVAFPVPDVVADLDRDRLSVFPSAGVDFVIASHVLEHLADPLGMVDEIHRVLRVGGIALILLPDRRATFDAGRPPTPLAHLVAEHDAGVRAVTDEHVIEFVQAVEPGRAPPTAAEIEHHRRRSIHVHCWNEEEFVPVLTHGARVLGHRWRFVDGLRTGVPGSVGIEFGAVLQKEPPGGDADVVAARLEEDWRRWYEGTVTGPVGDDPRVADLESRLAAMQASISWWVTAPLRAVSAVARSGWRRQRR